MMMRKSLMVAALLGLSAMPALAQQPGMGQGMRMGSGMQMGGGEGSMGPLTAKFGMYAPSAVLGIKGHLSLTPAQEAKLTELAATSKKAEDDAHAPAHAAHMELNKALAAEPLDLEVIRAQFTAHHTAEGNTQWIRASIAMQVKALLTPTQRTMVEQMAGGAMKH